MAPEPLVICHVCGVTRNESLTEHLHDNHLDQFFEIDADPDSGVSVIQRRCEP